MMPSSFGDSEKNEAFCWPCFGIITNITNDPSNIIQDGQYWETKFSDFKPLGSGIFSNENHCPKHVILSFKSDWGGFKNAMEFEKWFKARGKCREEWVQQKTCLGLRLYGWAAREEDYKSDTPLGEFLRHNTTLKTIMELILEASTSREKIICGLANEVKLINKNRNQVRTNYNQKRMTTVEMLREQDKMYQCFDEDKVNGTKNLYQDVIIKERQSNDELQGVRKELIKSLSGMKTSYRVKIGVKRMGEIDTKAFKKACNQRFRPEDVETRALELCSFWQEKVKNDAGIHQRVLNEDDKSLCELKNEWGEEIYKAVVTALKEMLEYNPRGCYLVQEFWNFKENKKATLKEVIGHVCTQLKTRKRKRF